jgi:hypothetical protein
LYSSLDKADIAIEDQGKKVAVQTDHRDSHEILAEIDLSIIFGLTRALNPIRYGKFEQVRFTFIAETPPNKLTDALVAAGSEIEVMAGDGTPTILQQSASDEDAMLAHASDALSALGREVFARQGLDVSAEGLEQLQQALRGWSADDKEMEIPYWTALIELGAATGELIRELFGGQWVRDPQDFAIIPFMFASKDGMLTNVFGKAAKFFEHGDSEAPILLLRSMADRPTEAPKGGHPIVFNLRPNDWGAKEFAYFKPVLDSAEDGLLLALARDMLNSTQTFPNTIDGLELQAAMTEARAHIAALQVNIEQFDVGELPIVVTTGDYYAGEKLLDEAHMKAMHRRLETGLLLAAVPAKGILMVTNAVTEPAQTLGFAAAVQGQFEGAEHAHQLSPVLYLVQEGRLVGVARPTSADGPTEPLIDEADPEPPKKSFWQRLFGG